MSSPPWSADHELWLGRSCGFRVDAARREDGPRSQGIDLTPDSGTATGLTREDARDLCAARHSRRDPGPERKRARGVLANPAICGLADGDRQWREGRSRADEAADRARLV